MHIIKYRIDEMTAKLGFSQYPENFLSQCKISPEKVLSLYFFVPPSVRCFFPPPRGRQGTALYRKTSLASRKEEDLSFTMKLAARAVSKKSIKSVKPLTH